MSSRLPGWNGCVCLLAVVILLGAAILLGTSALAAQDPKSMDQEELLKRIDKLLDDKLARLKDELSKDLKEQNEANNKQVLAAALILQKSLKESLGNVADRAANFERSFKILLIQTSLFNEHGPSIGTAHDNLEDESCAGLGIKKGCGTRVTAVLGAPRQSKWVSEWGTCSTGPRARPRTTSPVTRGRWRSSVTA